MFPLIGPVEDDAGHADGLAVGAVLGLALDRDPANRTIRTQDLALEIEGAGFKRSGKGRLDRRPILGHDVGQEVGQSPGWKGSVISEDTIVPPGPPRGVVDEVEVPGSHPGGVESERQGLARRLDFAGALGDAALQRLVGDPQPVLGFLAFQDVLAGLILTPTDAERRSDRADQGLGVDRPFQQNDVAEPLDHGRGPARSPSDLAGGEHDEREVRPGGLGIDPCMEIGRISVEERLLGDDRRARPRLQTVQPCRHVGADLGGGADLGQQRRHHGRVAAARGQDQDAIPVALRHRHHAVPGPAGSFSSMATAPP